MLDSGMPESFSVLIHELRGLCLDTQLLGGDQEARRKAAAKAAVPQADEALDDLLSGTMKLS